MAAGMTPGISGMSEVAAAALEAAMWSGSVGSSVVRWNASTEPMHCSWEDFGSLREGFDGLMHART